MNIILVGYRGCGKSSVAPLLASRLHWAWCDADVELEQQAGRTIKEIFASDGEAGFRRLERETLVRLLDQDSLVLAAGGGAILNAETRADFRASGPVIWLLAGVETIIQRISADQTTAARRPALTKLGVADEIEALLKVREPLYREVASIIIPTDSRTPAQIVDEIMTQLPAEIVPAAPGQAGGAP